MSYSLGWRRGGERRGRKWSIMLKEDDVSDVIIGWTIGESFRPNARGKACEMRPDYRQRFAYRRMKKLY